MTNLFVNLQDADPVNDVEIEWGIFDGRGMLAASYRCVRTFAHAWVYNREDAGIERWLILDSEARAQAFCEAVARERGLVIDQLPPPDLDEMFRDLSR